MCLLDWDIGTAFDTKDYIKSVCSLPDDAGY